MSDQRDPTEMTEFSDSASVPAFAERLAAICVGTLGEMVTSVILHGSLTLGDYTPGRSDIDLLVIVERALTDREIEELTSAVVTERSRAPSRVDFRVVTRDVAATPTPTPPMELYIALNPKAESVLESRHPGEEDLVVEFSMSREHGRALVGADPRELIGAIPDEWVLSIGDSYLAKWEALTADAPHAELMVLTGCRIWRFSEEGSHCSKAAAGEWALDRDPSLEAVRVALRQRSVNTSQAIDPAEIGRLLGIVRACVARREARTLS